jgi:hypothetical protein
LFPATIGSVNGCYALSRLSSNIVHNRAQRVICALDIGDDSFEGIKKCTNFFSLTTNFIVQQSVLRLCRL